VWPHVRTKIEGRLSEIKDQHQKNNDGSQTHDIIIVEAALLLETNWHDLLDGLWVIQSSPSVAVRRLKDNRGLTEEEATTRINAQQKRRGIGNAEEPDKFQQDIEKGVVTAVITNDGTLEELQAALKQALLDPSSFKS
jgi:dephospho-CoA kinase